MSERRIDVRGQKSESRSREWEGSPGRQSWRTDGEEEQMMLIHTQQV